MGEDGVKRRPRAELEILRRQEAKGGGRAKWKGYELEKDSTRTDGSADAAGPASESRKVGTGRLLRAGSLGSSFDAVGGKWLPARPFPPQVFFLTASFRFELYNN